jgi:hypothetical protein
VKHREYVRKNKDRINAKQRAVYYPRHQSKKKGEVVTPIVPAPKVKQRESVRKNKDRINTKQRTVINPRRQSKKKGEVVTPIVPAPLVETPTWTMIVSPGNHLVCFD